MRRYLAALLMLLLPLAASAAPRSGDTDKSTGSGPYLAMEPFVVNVQDGARLRFMQVKVQLMSTNPQVLEVLKANLPPLRDAILMLLSHQNAETLQSIEAREALRAEALTASIKVFAQLTGADPNAPAPAVPPVEAVYFTDFIIQ